MSIQPFDYYKNKDVEYDYIIQATVKCDVDINDILPLIDNEDLLNIYFPQVALGRVYVKCENINSKLHFTFGISLIDARDTVNYKNLEQSIKDFIKSLNKNIEKEPKLNIEDGDIKVEELTEQKINIDNIDKMLVSESNLLFTNGANNQKLVLTSDGIVESYTNNSLSNTMPFSKLGVIRECKGLLAKGYKLSLTEANITIDNNDNMSNDNILANPEQTKKDLQQQITDVEEIQGLQDELEDKLATLNEDITDEDCIIVVYTNINGNYEPDVALKNIDGTTADSVEDACRLTQEYAEKVVGELNGKSKDENPKYIFKVVKLDDVDNLQGLYEQKLTEDTRDELFPSTKFTSRKFTATELADINFEQDLSIEQIAWLQANIGNVYEIEDGIRNFSSEMRDFSEPIISLDEYFNNLKEKLKGV